MEIVITGALTATGFWTKGIRWSTFRISLENRNPCAYLSLTLKCQEMLTGYVRYPANTADTFKASLPAYRLQRDKMVFDVHHTVSGFTD